MRKLHMLFCSLILYCSAPAQETAPSHPTDWLGRLARSRPDTIRVRLLLQLSSFYLLKPGEENADLDSALLLAGEAKWLSSILRYHQGAEEADYWTGRTLIEGKRYAPFYEFLQTVSEDNQLKLTNQLIKYKLQTPGRTFGDEDSAEYYCRRLLTEARRIRASGLLANAWIQLASSPLVRNDLPRVKITLTEGFEELKTLGSPADRLGLAYQILLHLDPGDSLYDQALRLREQVREESKTPLQRQRFLQSELDEISLWSTISLEYFYRGRSDWADRGMNRIATIFSGLEDQWPVFMFVNLSYFCYAKGDYARSLRYGLRAVELQENGKSKEISANPYSTIARIYSAQGKTAQSLDYWKKAFAIELASGQPNEGLLPKYIVRDYLTLGRPAEALAFLQENTRPEIKYSLKGDKYIAESFGNAYFGMGDYNKAEQYFGQSLAIARTLDHLEQLIVFLPLAKLYVQTQRFDKAKSYLDTLQRPENALTQPVRTKQEVAFLAYQADSALGDYPAATRQLKLSKQLKDSLFNETANRQFEELKIQYETEKKDKDIQLLNRQSQLQSAKLNQQRTRFQLEHETRLRDLAVIRLQSEKKDNDLKVARFEAEREEQNIRLLNNQQELQRSDLRHARIQKNLLIAGWVLLLLLLALIYGRYRQKQQTSRLLEEKQTVIDRSHQELTQLNSQQQKLLIEKEWLVKEIHHRVKNNLQIVISLLNEHAEFLSNPSALQAIRESKERMQAIALIHQRLYQSENNARVDMHTYIDELVDSIADNFEGARRIRFQRDIARMSLDISQAVPIGLILNEAVTNSIKYAGIRNGGGWVGISLQPTGTSGMHLEIADNGLGLPVGLDTEHSKSLGLQLIRLFAQQLNGRLHFINNGGLKIVLDFTLVRFMVYP